MRDWEGAPGALHPAGVPRAEYRPIGLTGVPYEQHSLITAFNPGTGLIFDGYGGWEWRPWNLFIALEDASGQSDRWAYATAPLVAPEGSCTVQLDGLLAGGMPYVRRWTIAPRRATSVDVSAFVNARLSILQWDSPEPSLQQYRIRMNLTNNPINIAPDRRLYLMETYAADGVYSVPPGALNMTPYAQDAGFQWRAFGTGLAAAAQLNVTQSVKGTQFRTSIAGYVAVWEIQI